MPNDYTSWQMFFHWSVLLVSATFGSHIRSVRCRDNYFAAALWAKTPISFKNDGRFFWKVMVSWEEKYRRHILQWCCTRNRLLAVFFSHFVIQEWLIIWETRCIAGCGVPCRLQSRLHAASVFPSIFYTTAPLTAKVVSELTVSIWKQCDEQLER